LLAKLVCLNPIKALHAATVDNDDDDSDDGDDNAEDNNDAGQRIEKWTETGEISLWEWESECKTRI